MTKLDEIEKSLKKIMAWTAANNTVREWAPISTAPKDGQNILGYKDGVMATVRWLGMEQYWTLCVPGTFTLYHDWDPTHWMALPPPPHEKGVWKGGSGGKK
jgi:hypothetical protein